MLENIEQNENLLEIILIGSSILEKYGDILTVQASGNVFKIHIFEPDLLTMAKSMGFNYY